MADKVIVDFDLNALGFERGAQAIGKSANDLKGTLVNGLKGAIFATFSVEALKRFNAEFKEFVDEITISQKQTGASTTDLQVWEKQIKKVGGSMEDVARIIEKLGAARDKALENPSGNEAKAFAGLGISRTTLIDNDAPELFKRLQEQISSTGSAAGSLGNLMDLLGEKSVKFLSIFGDSFAATEDKLKKAGRLIDSELIARYKELQKLDKEISVGDAVLGGAQGKGELMAAIQDAWVHAKSTMQFATIPVAALTDVLGISNNASGRIWNQVTDTQTRLTLNGSKSLFGGALPEGTLTPSQHEEISNRLDNEMANRQTQLKRIKELQATNAEKALTDEEKLAKMYKEQDDLLKHMASISGDRTKRTEYLDDYEKYLRAIPKINELQDKVDKDSQRQAEEAARKQAEQDKTVEDYVDKIKKGFLGNYTMQDSLVSTGNFLGTGRQRLEDLTVRQTEILEDIRSALIQYLQQNPSTKGTTGFPDF